jgi:hypothetical protein
MEYLGPVTSSEAYAGFDGKSWANVNVTHITVMRGAAPGRKPVPARDCRDPLFGPERLSWA